MLPIIGQIQISEIARVTFLLHEQYGRIVRLGGLWGRPDLLFVYDADEIEKVCIKDKTFITDTLLLRAVNQVRFNF